MNKGTLIQAFAAASNVKASEAKATVEILAGIYESTLLTGEEVVIPGVGKLKVVTKAARNGRNPKTGEAIQIPAKRVVEFTPSAEFKEKVSPV